MDKTEIFVAGGFGLAVIGALAIAGRSSSSGAVGIAPNPQSVASIEAAAVQQIQAYNTGQTARAQVASQTILGLASIDANKTVAVTTDAGSTTRAQIAADAATKSAGIVAAAQQVIAQYQTAAQESVAASSAGALEAAAQASSAASQAQSAAQVQASQNAANAQKSVASDNMWGNIVGSITKALGSIFG